MMTVLRSSRFRAVSLGLVGVLAGCGDDGGDECVVGEACGGEITGQWTFESLCAVGTFALPTCDEGATVDFGGVEVSGTLTFHDDGTYIVHLMAAGDARFTVPGVCVPDGASCDDLESDTTSCTASGDGCQCTAPTFVEAVNDETGTWEVSGTMLSLVSEGEPNAAIYCVDGDVLTLQAVGDDGAVDFAYVLNRN